MTCANCARCAELEMQVRAFRSMRGVEDQRVAKLMVWWDVGETTARVAMRLFAEPHSLTWSLLALTLPFARSKGATKMQVNLLRAVMDDGAIYTLPNGAGYEMSAVGRDEINRALAS